jgi:hypothetical protein
MLNFHYILYFDPEVDVIEDDFTCPYHQLDFTAIAFNTAAIAKFTIPTGFAAAFIAGIAVTVS